MTREVLKTIDQNTLMDLTYDVIEYCQKCSYDFANDEIHDKVHDMILEALGINNNHNGIGFFKAEIVDVYEDVKEKEEALIYCSNARSTYSFDEWRDDFDPYEPQYERAMAELYDEDIATIEESDYDNFIYTIKEILKRSPIVMSGIGATWCGRNAGGYIFTDIEKFKKLIYPGYESTVTFMYNKKDKDLYMTESSHDCPTGGTCYHFRLMTDKGHDRWYTDPELYDSESDREVIGMFFNSDELTRPFELEEL